MRWVAFCVVGLLLGFSREARGQERLNLAIPRTVAPAQPRTTSPKSTVFVDTDEDPVASAKRLSDALTDRLRPLERRFQEDARLRNAGALVGIGALAVGALQRQSTLTFVGTEAMRIGFDRQLSAVRTRTGFSIAPSISRHHFSVVLSRTLP